MDPCLLDVLHDARDDDVLAVAQRIHITLGRALQEVVNQHRPLLRILNRRRHVAHDRLVVVRDHHGATAQHIARPHQHRIAHTIRARNRLCNAGRHRALWLRDLQLFDQLPKPLAVFSQVDRLRRRPNDRHARSLQRQRQVQRRLAAELHNHPNLRAARSLMLIDRQHVFQRQRLKVEPVAGVIVGRDRLRVAVHHNGLVSVLTQRKRSVAAAVVELNALPDAVRPTTQDDDLLARRRRLLVLFVVAAVEIRRVALKLRRAGIDQLVHRLNPELRAQLAHFVGRLQPPLARNALVRDAHALGRAQIVRTSRPCPPRRSP